MGLSIGGLQGGGSSIAGTAATALSFTATQASGSNAFVQNTGARLKIGGGTTDYLTSDGSATITAAGAFTVTTGLVAGANVTMSGSAPLLFWSSGASTTGQITTSITAANAGATAAAAMIKVYPQLALDAADWVLSLGTASNAASVFAVAYSGAIVLPTTDSSGTPGAAAISQACGRSAIAAGASSCVITNTLVTAASHVFIQPIVRDATGVLPIVVPGAGIFTVSTTVNCTATLSFDWFVVS